MTLQVYHQTSSNAYCGDAFQLLTAATDKVSYLPIAAK